MPAARRAFAASEICAEPRLMEPMFLCEVQVPLEMKGGVY